MDDLTIQQDLITAPDLARRLGWPSVRFRDKLRAQGFRWHIMGERWSFPFGSDQARDMLRVFRECGGQIDAADRPI